MTNGATRNNSCTYVKFCVVSYPTVELFGINLCLLANAKPIFKVIVSPSLSFKH